MRNQLGDITHILNADGLRVANYTYDAYGNIIDSFVLAGYGHIGDANAYNYRGYRYDSEINLYYLNSRYYNPEVGRFISSDGLLAVNGDILSSNMYSYCKNNPVMNIDPSGYLSIHWQRYIPYATLFAAFVAVVGSVSAANKALYAGGTTVFKLIWQAISNLKVLATIGAIPVWGWIIMGVVGAVVITSATIIIAALVQGKGIMMGMNVKTRWFKIKKFSLELKIQ